MSIFRKDRLRLLNETVDALGAQLAAMSLQSAALSSQTVTNSVPLGTVRRHCDAVGAELDQLRTTVAEMGASVKAQAKLIELQGRQIARLESDLGSRDESLKQLSAGQIRLERQARSDLEEIRTTNAALANQLLLGPSSGQRLGHALDRPNHVAQR